MLALLRRVMTLSPENTAESLQSSMPETAIAVMALNDLEPLISQQFPDLLTMFLQAKIHANSVVAADALKNARDRDEADRSFHKPFAEKLEELERAESEKKLDDSKIFQLVRVAETEENYKQAESWIDKMTDEIAREGTFNYFYFQRSKLASKEKRFDDARKYALKIVKIEHRAVLFFDVAEAKMKEPMTKLESLDTLLEVYQTALKAPDTVEKAQVLLGLAFMYEKVDHYNALNSLADAIKTANKLENPNLFTSYVSQQIKGKRFTHYSSYSVPGFEITETFYEISKKDFQNALNYTTSFSDKYLRTLAVLATVKDCEKNDAKIKKAKTK
jgi:tetratricopeptide (TPR) repeat protein